MGLSGATLVCVVNTVAFATRGIGLAEVAFGLVLVTALVIFSAFFWGFYMAMSGNVPAGRLKYLLPHGAVGTLSPLFYTINISIDLDRLGQRVNVWSLATSFGCLAILLIQFGMGKAVVRPEPLRILPRTGTDG